MVISYLRGYRLPLLTTTAGFYMACRALSPGLEDCGATRLGLEATVRL